MADLIPAFPNELAIEIVSHISCRSTLSALSRQSRALHKHVTPILYHTYQNRRAASPKRQRRNYGHPNAGQADGCGRPFGLFLRTLVTNPSLALLVKRLDVGPWEVLQDLTPASPDRFLAYPPRVRQLLLDAGVRAGLDRMPLTGGPSPHSGKCMWADLLCGGCEDAEVALLAALCSNVEEVFLRVPRNEDNLTLPPTRLDWKNYVGSWWPKFRRLRLEGSSEYVELGDMGDFTSLPSLNTFEFVRIWDDQQPIEPQSSSPEIENSSDDPAPEQEDDDSGDGDGDDDQAQLAPPRPVWDPMTTLTTVRMIDASFSFGGFYQLCKICCALQVFEYTNRGPVFFDPSHVKEEGIGQVSNTLRRLKFILLEKKPSVEEVDLGIDMHCGSFSKFVALEELEIEQEMLLKPPSVMEKEDLSPKACYKLSRALPPSIKELWLKRCNGDIIGYLFEFHPQKWRFPNLQRLSISFAEGEGVNLDGFKDVFAAMGVHLTWSVKSNGH